MEPTRKNFTFHIFKFRCNQFRLQEVQPLRYLHDCSDCFRLERLPGGIFTHWKAPPLHGARHKRSFAEVGKVHPKAMRMILTTAEEHDVWMRAPLG